MRAGGLVPHLVHAAVGRPEIAVPMGPSPHVGQYQCRGCGEAGPRMGHVHAGCVRFRRMLIHTLVMGDGLSM